MTGARLGVLGGTFDPIHRGHVHIAETVRDLLGLERVLLTPSRTPPHRSALPHASAFHRFAMTALAAAGRPGLVASDMELEREGPSYTIDTLERLSLDGFRPSQIFFITGADAFAEIATWRAYPRLLDAGHFVAVERPGFGLPQLTERLPELAERFLRVPAGARAADVLDARLASAPLSVILVDATVPDVSSTEIRKRLAQGLAIRDLVAPHVAEYIAHHRLYEPSAAASRCREATLLPEPQVSGPTSRRGLPIA